MERRAAELPRWNSKAWDLGCARFLAASLSPADAARTAGFRFEDLRRLTVRWAGGQIAVLPLTELIEPGDRWFPRHQLVNAKRPNEKGEIPLGGAY